MRREERERLLAISGPVLGSEQNPSQSRDRLSRENPSQSRDQLSRENPSQSRDQLSRENPSQSSHPSQSTLTGLKDTRHPHPLIRSAEPIASLCSASSGVPLRSPLQRQRRQIAPPPTAIAPSPARVTICGPRHRAPTRRGLRRIPCRHQR